MTTIAVSRSEMACDSRQSGDEQYFKVADKILIVDNELIGSSGDSDQIAKFLTWYRKSDDGSDPPRLSDTTNVVVLNEDGIYYYAGCGYPTLIDERFFAVGSGALAALAAMSCGKSPMEAVRIACKFDKNSGPPIRNYKLRGRK